MCVAQDRIICDVPCSGDGTLRKIPEAWKQWHPDYGIKLHSLQLTIALRGLALLRVGGIMCYSTCTFNPIEDEAVVGELLRVCGGAVELMDATTRLPQVGVCRELRDVPLSRCPSPVCGAGARQPLTPEEHVVSVAQSVRRSSSTTLSQGGVERYESDLVLVQVCVCALRERELECTTQTHPCHPNFAGEVAVRHQAVEGDR